MRLLAIVLLCAALSSCGMNPAFARIDDDHLQSLEQRAAYGDSNAKAILRFMQDAGTIVGFDAMPVSVNCCHKGDAYEADDYEIDPTDGAVIAILTCNDPSDCWSGPGRSVHAPGERIKVPPNAWLVKDKPKNDTGHGWIFLGTPTDEDGEVLDGPPSIYCYAPPTGF